MTLSPSFRKLVLTLHIISTMVWLGSVAAYIPIAVYVLTNQDAEMVQSTIQIMSLVINFIVVPMAFASLLTGVVLSLGTRWGLFRHYWVLFKLILTVIAVLILVAYTQELNEMASIASTIEISILQDREHIAHTIGGLLVLIVATVLSVYKPKGMTRYGWRKQMDIKGKSDFTPYSIPRWTKMTGVGAIVLFLVFVVLIFLRMLMD
ncbi:MULTISPECIES: hypothetical protein [Bacillaceae]|uniref:hypothetical protein n=1 Tax=Bacillaceae TaxID=186817 RepID=UPI00103888F2|nr:MULTISPECIES: hypothetical protein [Bacillaceae]TBV84986.1 hypothetical protein EW028_23090 [Lysinibacillus sp. OL1]